MHPFCHFILKNIDKDWNYGALSRNKLNGLDAINNINLN